MKRNSKIVKADKKQELMKTLVENPSYIVRELNNRRFFNFFQWCWPEISADDLVLNWHIEYLCDELQEVAERAARGEKKAYDLLINIPPGTSKTSIVMKAFPVWCWTKWFWMRFITASYSQTLSLESGEASRDLIRSDRFRQVYPELEIKADKDVKSNYKIIKKDLVYQGRRAREINGGNRFSTSVGGTVTGFHGHILLVDDPLNTSEATSVKILQTTNRWIDQTFSNRKIDKATVPTIMIMQRLHQDDPSGHWLSKKNKKIKHICLPAELDGYADLVNPPELKERYVDGLLDPYRLSPAVLQESLIDYGQYGYSGQMGQKPTPPGDGMFKTNNFTITHTLPQPHDITEVVRYWDKAGSAGTGAYTCGVKMAKLSNGKFLIMDVRRKQWGTDDRETNIKRAALADGTAVSVYVEQEPGSGGKESAEHTIRNLAGFRVEADRPQGDKVYRADPYSVQVNYGNVMLLYGEWNKEFIDEHENFPLSKYKDQVDAASGAFAKLTSKRKVRVWD